jgi:hypothetical protein
MIATGSYLDKAKILLAAKIFVPLMVAALSAARAIADWFMTAISAVNRVP